MLGVGGRVHDDDDSCVTHLGRTTFSRAARKWWMLQAANAIESVSSVVVHFCASRTCVAISVRFCWLCHDHRAGIYIDKKFFLKTRKANDWRVNYLKGRTCFSVVAYFLSRAIERSPFRSTPNWIHSDLSVCPDFWGIYLQLAHSIRLLCGWASVPVRPLQGLPAS